MSVDQLILPTTPAELQALLHLHQSILDALPLGLVVYAIETPTALRVVSQNAIGRYVDPDNPVDLCGMLLEETVPPEAAAQLRRHLLPCIERGVVNRVEDRYDLPSGVIWTRSVFSPVRDADGRITHVLAMWEDITASKLREHEERAQQESIILHQQATLEELSTPVLSISDTTVVMPLVGAIDSRRVNQLMTTLLDAVADRRASIVILDITGVVIVDTHVANALVHAAQAVKLLGAQVVLTGIRAEVAQTLVSLSVDLQGIIPRGTLRDGIAYALREG